jgi:predicted transcriptional regulator
MSDSRLQPAQDTELDPEAIAAIAARLDAMDRSHPWTRDALHLIAGREGIDAIELAGSLGRELSRLKTDVRRLMTLGLVERVEAGYRITPHGQAFINAEASGRV